NWAAGGSGREARRGRGARDGLVSWVISLDDEHSCPALCMFSAMEVPGSVPDGVAGLVDFFERAFDGVFHDGHAAADGVLDELKLTHRVYIQLATGALLFFLGLTENLFAALAGLLGDRVLGNQGFGALICLLDDAAGLVLRIADDAFAVLDHALGLSDLVWQRDAELVDEAEKVFLLDHDAPAHGNAFAEADQLLKLV